jgi:hypothetical protein
MSGHLPPGSPNVFPPTTAEYDALYRRLAAENDGMTFGSLTPKLMAVAQASSHDAIGGSQIVVATADHFGEFMTGYRAELTGRHEQGRVIVGMARDIRDKEHGATLEDPTDLLAVFANVGFEATQGRRMRPIFDRMSEIIGQLLLQ